MCELLGLSAKKRRKVNDALREFFSHSNDHPHGWGLARFAESGIAEIDKECVKASESPRLSELLSAPLEERSLIAHIRLATIGGMEYSNCHPFRTSDNTRRVWTLAHNGTIFHSRRIDHLFARQFGATDSERVLMYLVDQVDERQIRLGRALNAQERFDAVAQVVDDLAGGNKLNLLIHDGETLYAHTNFRDSLHYSAIDDALWLSTRPLSQGEWRPLPFARLVAIRDGELTREGAPHGKEYIYSPDDYRYLYMDFARL